MLTIQVIGGFTQDEGRWNGCLELKEQLLSTLDDYSALSVRVRFDRWNADWRGIARQMHLLRLRYRADPFTVVVFAYSWGVGNGLVKLAKELERYGIDVKVAVIADGIYRHWWSKLLFQWRALIGGYQITIPQNVLELHGFHQEVSRPMGMKPIGNGEVSWMKLQYPHVELHHAPEWHDLCVKIAEREAMISVRGKSQVPIGSPKSEATESRVETS